MKKFIAIILTISVILACLSISAYAIDLPSVQLPGVKGAVNDVVAVVANEVNYYVGLVMGEADYVAGEISTVLGDHIALISEKLNVIITTIIDAIVSLF